MQNLFMKSSASISECGKYRYTLFREWEPSLPRVLFVMLNPSTADAMEDDPTITKCLGFARLWGCGSLTVVNLFAFRATNPKELLTAVDPIGPENDVSINLCAQASDRIVVAWGANKMPKSACNRIGKVLAMLAGRRIECLKLTKSGAPKHPLYVPYATELEYHS